MIRLPVFFRMLPLLVLPCSALAAKNVNVERQMDPGLASDAETLAVMAREIPPEFASYPVVAMRRTTTITITDDAIKADGEGGGGRKAWIAEWHGIDRIQHASGFDHANFSFSYSRSDGDLLLPEKRRIRPDGSYLRTTVHEVMDEVVDADPQRARYRRSRKKKFSLREVQAGDFTEVRTKEHSTRKMGRAGFGDSYWFGALPALEERICYQMSPSVPFQYQLLDPSGTVEVETEEGADQKRYCFTRRGQPPEIREDYSPSRVYQTPLLRVTTWEDWGGYVRWLRKKYRGKMKANDEIRALVRDLTAGLDEQEAIREVFHWVAENIHYVQAYFETDSGFVPVSAEEVFRRRYGDCKEKTAMLISMLALLDVQAIPALIATRSSVEADPDFPMMYQFGHMITYLPERDLFLDPVAENTPFPYLLPMDQDRPVLILHDRRVQSGRTPWMEPEQAQRSKSSQVELRIDEAQRSVELIQDAVYSHTGQYSAKWHRKRIFSEEKMEDYLASDWLSGGILESWSFDHGLDELNKPVVLRVRFRHRASDVSFGEGPLPTHIMLPVYLGLPDDDDFYRYPQRSYPYNWFTWPCLREKSYQLRIPQGYTVAYLPKDLRYEHPDGIFSYQASFEQEGDLLLLSEVLRVARPVLEAEEFLALRPVIAELSSAVENRLLLVREP